MVPPQSPAAARGAPTEQLPGSVPQRCPGSPSAPLGCSSPLVSVSLRLRAKSLQAAGLPARSSPAGSSAFSALRTLWKIAAPGSFKPACVFTGSLAGGFVALSPGRSSGAELRGRPPAVPPPRPARRGALRCGGAGGAGRGAGPPPRVPTRGLGGGGLGGSSPRSSPSLREGIALGKSVPEVAVRLPSRDAAGFGGFPPPLLSVFLFKSRRGRSFLSGAGRRRRAPRWQLPAFLSQTTKRPGEPEAQRFTLLRPRSAMRSAKVPRLPEQPPHAPRDSRAPASPQQPRLRAEILLSTASTSRPRSLGSCLFG